jgi:hypothetical protein
MLHLATIGSIAIWLPGDRPPAGPFSVRLPVARPPGSRGYYSGAIRETPQQTVDGLQRTLEIGARSSYVPKAPIGVRSRFPEDTRPSTQRGLRAWNYLLWMK